MASMTSIMAGSDRRRRLGGYLFAAVALFCTAGCGIFQDAQDAARAQAADDLQCPMGSISTEETFYDAGACDDAGNCSDSETYVDARGCGRVALYRCSPDLAAGYSCDLVDRVG